MIVAVRDGVRAGALTEWEEDPASMAEDEARVSLSSGGVDLEGVVTRAAIVGNVPNKLIQLEVRAGFEPLFGLVPTPESIGASLTMRLEDQPSEEDEHDWDG